MASDLQSAQGVVPNRWLARLSIGLKMVLVIAIITMCYLRYVEDHYYKEFTGFVLMEAATQIEAGNSEHVREVLSEVRGKPTRVDLVSIWQKLKTRKPIDQNAVDGVPDSGN